MQEEITFKGYFIKPDFSEIITEDFAERFTVNIKQWLVPYGYFDEQKNMLICQDGVFPDGTYIAVGVVQYPGKFRNSFHRVGQFNVVRSRGIDLLWGARFQDYPGLPKDFPVNAKFPLIKVGEVQDYIKAKDVFERVYGASARFFLERELKRADPDSVEAKVIKLRLALKNLLENNQEF